MTMQNNRVGQLIEQATRYEKGSTNWAETADGVRFIKHRYDNNAYMDMKDFMWIKLKSSTL